MAVNAWYYEEVRKAVAAGYIAGYSDNTFRADTPITRQEAAVMVARVVSPARDAQDADHPQRQRLGGKLGAALCQGDLHQGYMEGDDNGNFRPEDPLTRAAAAKVITTLLEGETIITSNQTISIDDMKYKDTLFANNVTISSALGSGGVTLENCRVIGMLTVNGGGASSGLVLTTRPLAS